MDRIIELGYILTLFISVACFTVHVAIRAKNLTSTSRMLKWRSTTAFVFIQSYKRNVLSFYRASWVETVEIGQPETVSFSYK